MFFVLKVNAFQGSNARPATADKNGLMPVFLESLNGEIPERARVISGTVAERAGFQVGKVYLTKVTFTGTDAQYGDRYAHSTVGEIAVLDIALNLAKFPRGIVQVAQVAEEVAAEDKDGKF